MLFVRNLPWKITAEELYDTFGRYGALRQVRVGTAPETRGSAYVVYEDIFDAKAACEALSGFNVAGRYLIVLYYQASRARGARGGAGAGAVDALKADVSRLRAAAAAAGVAAPGGGASGGVGGAGGGGGGGGGEDDDDLALGDDDDDKRLVQR